MHIKNVPFVVGKHAVSYRKVPHSIVFAYFCEVKYLTVFRKKQNPNLVINHVVYIPENPF